MVGLVGVVGLWLGLRPRAYGGQRGNSKTPVRLGPAWVWSTAVSYVSQGHGAGGYELWPLFEGAHVRRSRDPASGFLVAASGRLRAMEFVCVLTATPQGRGAHVR